MLLSTTSGQSIRTQLTNLTGAIFDLPQLTSQFRHSISIGICLPNHMCELAVPEICLKMHCWKSRARPQHKIAASLTPRRAQGENVMCQAVTDGV
jgi:hypothetical protein